MYNMSTRVHSKSQFEETWDYPHKRKTVCLFYMHQKLCSAIQHEKAHANPQQAKRWNVSIFKKKVSLKLIIKYFIRAYLCGKCKKLYNTIVLYESHLGSCNGNNTNFDFELVIEDLTEADLDTNKINITNIIKSNL